MRKTLLLAVGLLALFLAGCDRSGVNDGPDYRKTNGASADFGFRALYGLNDSDDFDRVLRLSNGFLYDADDQRISPSDEQATLAFDDVPVTSDDFDFDFVPGREYTVTATLNGEAVSGSVTAPSISEIQFVGLPDTVTTDQKIEVQWRYPAGEDNDGAVIFRASGYSSGLLDPSTTSHTIPADALQFQTGSTPFEVLSVRYVLFPNMTNPRDADVVFIPEIDSEGSFFAAIVGINRYVEVERP